MQQQQQQQTKLRQLKLATKLNRGDLRQQLKMYGYTYIPVIAKLKTLVTEHHILRSKKPMRPNSPVGKLVTNGHYTEHDDWSVLITHYFRDVVLPELTLYVFIIYDMKHGAPASATFDNKRVRKRNRKWD